MAEMNTKNSPSSAEKILMVTEYFVPHWTGIAKSFYHLAHNLQAQGYKVTVLTTLFDHSIPAEGVLDGIPVVRVPYQFRFSRTHYSITIVWKFLKMLRSYDIVIVNSPNSNVLFYSMLTRLFMNRLVIYHQADIVMPRRTGNIVKSILIENVFDFLTIPSMFLAHTVSTFTQDYAEQSRVMRYSVKKFKPYIPAIRLSKGSPATTFKKSLDALKKHHSVIGISGRFVEEKGFDVLFMALPAILKAIPDAHILFAGKKIIEYEPFYERYRDLFENQKEHVTFCGLLDGGDLACFYQSLDVFVLSSRTECFALTQIEAWEKHVPIVVTDTPGARQFVKQSGFGEVVAVEDVAALVEGIIKVIKERPKYVKKHAAAQRFLEEYDTFNI